jgi:hypothetical protein
VRLQGSLGLDTRCNTSEINGAVRYFVFDRPPDMDELLPITGPPPAPLPPHLASQEELVDRLFRHALGRMPSPEEKKIALTAGVADLLWSLAMSPEFQLLR